MRRLVLLVGPVVAVGLSVAAPAASATATRAPHRSGQAVASASAHPSWLRAHGQDARRNDRSATPSAARTSSAPRLDAGVLALRAARNGTVRVQVSGDPAAVSAQVRRRGGRVIVSSAGASVVVVPKSAVRTLAGSSAVTRVAVVQRPVPTSTAPGSGQGVAASGASAWQAADSVGSGVRVGVIDGGFGSDQAEYDGQVAAGRVGDDPVVDNQDCVDAGNASTPYVDAHGLAVAEIVHQEAPGAQLYLYCVDSAEGEAQAELAAERDGVRIISSSLGWYLDSRGDGTGAAGSIANTARRARQHGILWVNSAGNEIPQHYGGALADADKDGYLDIGNHDADTYPYESNFYQVDPGTSDSPSDFTWYFQWDNWPSTTHQMTLEADGVQCTAAFGKGGTDNCKGTEINPITVPSSAGGDPTVAVQLSDFGAANVSAYPQIWEISAHFDTPFTAGAHYDLFGYGAAQTASDLSCPTGDAAGNCVFSAGAVNQSVVSPANSPYVLAVGAANSGADGSQKGALEYFSSRGPTIDGRIKPDLTGWDGVSSYLPEYADGFYGTSAAAPLVAGAAALVAAANPALDAAGVQSVLERRASHFGSAGVAAGAVVAPANGYGHGLLTLGATPASAPVTDVAGSRYTAITPRRILDTRTTTGGHKRALGNGGVVTLTVPGLPPDVTSVAVNLTGTGATSSSVLTAYPGGTAPPTTSNLNLSRTDPTAAVLAVVRVSGAHTISIRNLGATVNVVVDELGWFGTGSEAGRYTALAPSKRVLDTRTTVGGHKSKLATGRSVSVNPALPAGATAAIVNLTVVNAAKSGYLRAAPTCSGASSTLNFTGYARANLAIVPLSAHRFCVTGTGGPEDVVVDVVGYLSATGSEYHALPAPTRIIDTRTGNGGAGNGHASSAIAAGKTLPFYGGGVGDVPASATGLLTDVVVASATASGYLSLFPGTSPPAGTGSTVNFTAGRIVPNATVVNLSAAHQFGVFNNAGSTDVAVDVAGYFAPAP